MLSRIVTLLLIGANFVTGAPSIAKVVDCLAAAKVPQDLPGSTLFAQDIVTWNLRLQFTPQAFAIPKTVSQVQAAVKCAKKYGVKVNPKSGGHSYASHSIGGEDGHLVVDLRYFNSIKVDAATNIATVGPGARLGNTALALYNQGKRAFAHGICPGYVYPSSLQNYR